MKNWNSQRIRTGANVRSHITKYITFIAVFWSLIVINWNVGQIGVTLCHAQEETVYVVVDKAELVTADKVPSVVQIGNAKIADVNVASAKSIIVLGISTGETSLLLLDSAGNIIKNVNVVVIPKTEGRVTIHQGTTETKSLECGPKCVEVSGETTSPPPCRPLTNYAAPIFFVLKYKNN